MIKIEDNMEVEMDSHRGGDRFRSVDDEQNNRRSSNTTPLGMTTGLINPYFKIEDKGPINIVPEANIYQEENS
jgi:hypothetical protein